jgi:hypothetical protein
VKLHVLPVTIAAATVLAGCGLSPSKSATSNGDAISVPACSAPHGTQFVAVVTDSTAERSATLLTRREAALGAFAAEAVACRSQVEVIFDPGQAGSAVIYSGGVHITAATSTAYRRRATSALNANMLPVIDAALAGAESAAAPSVSSPVSAYQILADDRTGSHLDALVLTDMIQVDDHVNLDQPLTASRAAILAAVESVPRLASAQLTIAGVGVTSDTVAAPDDWLAAVRAFAAATCSRTGATCRVTTQVNP